MSIEHDIRAAKTPVEALTILAREIDAINARLDAEPTDPWAAWGKPTTMSETAEVQREVNAGRSEQIEREQEQHAQQLAATQQQLAVATDPEEIQALGARLRLLQDTGKPLLSPVDEGNRVRIASDGTTGDVELPTVSAERKQARAEWAFGNRLEEFIPLDAQQAVDAFVAGGPMWLYLGNRDAVMQLPYAARQWLVEEIALDSQAQAQEVGRDILKSADSTDKDITIQAIEAMSDARG